MSLILLVVIVCCVFSISSSQLGSGSTKLNFMNYVYKFENVSKSSDTSENNNSFLWVILGMLSKMVEDSYHEKKLSQKDNHFL